MSQFDPELLDLMKDVVIVESFTGKDSFGNPTYGAPANVPCYIEVNRARGDAQDTATTFGPEVAFTGTFWCPPDKEIHERDRLTLPGGLVTFVLSVTMYRDIEATGPHHQQVTYTARS